MFLQRVAADSGGANHFGHGDVSVLADVVDDLDGHLRQCGYHYSLSLHLGPQPALLLLQCLKKKISQGSQFGAAVRRSGKYFEAMNLCRHRQCIDFQFQCLHSRENRGEWRRLAVEHIAHCVVIAFQCCNLTLRWTQQE